MKSHGSGRRKCPWGTQFQAEKNKLPLFPDRMNSYTSCFQFEHSGGCWTQKSSPKSVIKMPGNEKNKCYLHFQFPKKPLKDQHLEKQTCCLCPFSFPHCNIHKSPNIPIMFAQETPPNRGGLRLCLSSLASGFCQPQGPNVPRFSLVFLLLQLFTFTILFPWNCTSLHLLLLADLADIDPINGEGWTEQPKGLISFRMGLIS